MRATVLPGAWHPLRRRAGVLGLQCREDDMATIEAVSPLGDPQTWREITAERTLLHVLQGHCNSPIAGYATSETDCGGMFQFRTRWRARSVRTRVFPDPAGAMIRAAPVGCVTAAS